MELFPEPLPDEPAPRPPCLYRMQHKYDFDDVARPLGKWYEEGRRSEEQLPVWNSGQRRAWSCWPHKTCMCAVCRSYASLMLA